MRWAPLCLLGFLAVPHVAQGQLAEAVARIEDGTVRFTYATRDDVEICDRGIRAGDRTIRWHMNGDRGWRGECRVGSAEVDLTVRNGSVSGVDIVDGRAPAEADTHVGTVAAAQVVVYLLSLARGDATASGAEEAVFPAALADVADIWRDLLELAKDRTVGTDVRKSAMFWVGQEAADVATAELSDLAMSDDEEQDIRNAAVFAISQRPNGEAVSLLIEIARTGNEAETRRKAMFWLAQSDDPRVVSFFEDVLLGRSR